MRASVWCEVCNLGRAALTAPLYVSLAWSLIISYQLFTQTAVYSLSNFLNSLWPTIGSLLTPRIETVVFIHAFAWIFVLASVIPSAILGKGRSVLLQFFLCLTLALVAVSVEHVFTFILGADTRMEVQTLSGAFMNPVIASLYLSAPYVFMLYLDIRSRRENVEEDREVKDESVEVVEGESPEEMENLGLENSVAIDDDIVTESEAMYD